MTRTHSNDMAKLVAIVLNVTVAVVVAGVLVAMELVVLATVDAIEVVLVGIIGIVIVLSYSFSTFVLKCIYEASVLTGLFP